VQTNEEFAASWNKQNRRHGRGEETSRSRHVWSSTDPSCVWLPGGTPAPPRAAGLGRWADTAVVLAGDGPKNQRAEQVSSAAQRSAGNERPAGDGWRWPALAGASGDNTTDTTPAACLLAPCTVATLIVCDHCACSYFAYDYDRGVKHGAADRGNRRAPQKPGPNKSNRERRGGGGDTSDYSQPLPLNFSPYINFSLYFRPYFFISRSGSP
jgi:hypothetical protein